MNVFYSKKYVFPLSIISLIFFVSIITLFSNPVSYAKSGFEYKILEKEQRSKLEIFESELNNLGQQGWELVSVDMEDRWYYFKRIK
ncbi:MAG: DUF4177 domain-containing protein [Desulforhopalus sp.]|nr:DUF4177 domain-containing protein [Desulforhopalus sp.]